MKLGLPDTGRCPMGMFWNGKLGRCVYAMEKGDAKDKRRSQHDNGWTPERWEPRE